MATQFLDLTIPFFNHIFIGGNWKSASYISQTSLSVGFWLASGNGKNHQDIGKWKTGRRLFSRASGGISGTAERYSYLSCSCGDGQLLVTASN